MTDIWSPGGPLPDKLNPALAALVAGVKKAGIRPVKFAGGHGSTGDYAPSPPSKANNLLPPSPLRREGRVRGSI